MVLVYFINYICLLIYAFIQLISLLNYTVLGPGLDTGDMLFISPILSLFGERFGPEVTVVSTGHQVH